MSAPEWNAVAPNVRSIIFEIVDDLKLYALVTDFKEAFGQYVIDADRIDGLFAAIIESRPRDAMRLVALYFHRRGHVGGEPMELLEMYFETKGVSPENQDETRKLLNGVL